MPQQKIPTDDAEIARLYLGGMSLTDVSRLMHITYVTARNRLRAMGVELRPPGTRLHPRCFECGARLKKDKARELFQAGLKGGGS